MTSTNKKDSEKGRGLSASDLHSGREGIPQQLRLFPCPRTSYSHQSLLAQAGAATSANGLQQTPPLL